MDFESYIALSYCWHGDDWQPTRGCDRTIDPGYLNINTALSEKMFDAFANMRYLKNEGMWIDQVCIDQGSDGENLQNINFMDVIYQTACLVVVVLEDIEIFDDEHDLVLQLTESHEAPGFPSFTEHFSVINYSVPQLHTFCNIYHRILLARWFSRAWYAHEFFLVKASVFLIPGKGKYVHKI
jgi:hypothetical protein